MSHRIAAVDVHKKMLAVVVTDVAEEGEYRFERHKFDATPGELHLLAQELVLSFVPDPEQRLWPITDSRPRRND